MEILSSQNISFSYPDTEITVLKNINFSIDQGEFIILCGPSGSGKSTLLHLIKHDIAPHGEKIGEFFYKGINIEKQASLVRAKEIGIVFQSPEDQIVMDTVMDELLFGLENVGYSTEEMRKRVAEIVHFFDINHLLDKKTIDLSGGEKQLINLASILLLDPEILLLDEPTGQLDPIASKEFIHTLERLNEEFGVTIIIVEHRLEELFAIADRVMVLEDGQMTYFNQTKNVVSQLATDSLLTHYLPSASQMYLTFTENIEQENIPLNVKEAKHWLNGQKIEQKNQAIENKVNNSENLLQLTNIDFQYNPYTSPVLNNLSLDIQQEDLHAIVGANGTGKSTLLKVISGILKAQHGHVKYNGKKYKKLKPGIFGYLPQNPSLFFVQDTIMKEYKTIAKRFNLESAEEKIEYLLKEFQLESLKDKHPYDLSGGQIQKAAMLGALLIKPTILLMDEPTKGLDPDSKERLGILLRSLMKNGLTIVMVTHDVEFAATYATKCSMLFQGQITVTEKTREFFQENMYYTTAMNRITRKIDVPQVVTLQGAKEEWLIQKDS